MGGDGLESHHSGIESEEQEVQMGSRGKLESHHSGIESRARRLSFEDAVG